MDDAIKFSILLELYGNLLTEKQYQLLDYFYNQDLGLSEIAENLGITRQAVRDNLKKGENNLVEFEEKMKLLKKEEHKKKIINDICNEIQILDLKSDIKRRLIKKINELI